MSTPIAPVHNVIWDLDGTLFDSYPGIVKAFVEVLNRDFNIVYPPEEILRLVKVDTKHCSATIGEAHGMDPTALNEQVRKHYDSFSLSSTVPFPFAAEACATVASVGKNVLVTHRDFATTMALLESASMQNVFVEIVTSDSGFAPKPSPASFNYVIDKHDLPRSLSLGVGDREMDVQAANECGIRSCYFDADEPSCDIATYVIRSLSELIDLVTAA